MYLLAYRPEGGGLSLVVIIERIGFAVLSKEYLENNVGSLPLSILKCKDDRKLSMLNKNASHSIEAIVGNNTRVGSLC